jgi:hypothetical protein
MVTAGFLQICRMNGYDELFAGSGRECRSRCRLRLSPRDHQDHASVAPHWADGIVLESLHCRKCGYDLRGLRADSRCPECGLEIWTSVEHTVDPAASHLPTLRNPRAVGNSLVALTACMLAGALLMLWPGVNGFLSSRGRSMLPEMPLAFWIAAATIATIGWWSMRTLAPPRGAEPNGTIWNDIWRIVVGFTGGLGFGCAWSLFLDVAGMTGIRQRLVVHLATVVLATIGLVGLRGVLNVIGYRSREYRRSQGGRQNVELIIAAIATGFAGAILYYLCRMGWLPREWANVMRTLVWASHFMVLIGLAYLVMNAWWIRRSLRKPPPPLDQVLAPNLPPDTWIPDREE